MDYTAVPLLEVVETVSNERNANLFEDFQHEVKGNLGTLQAFSTETNACYPIEGLDRAFAKKTDIDQPVFIDLNETVSPGTGSQSIRIGTGGPNRVDVQLVAQTRIEEGFQISRVNEASARFASVSMRDRMRYTTAYALVHALKNILVRAEQQAQSYLSTNKWAGGGLGQVFAAAGDYKDIPAGDDRNVFWDIKDEALDNKLIANVQSPLVVVGSNHMMKMLGITESYQAQNEVNLGKSLLNIEPYIASEMSPPTPATERALLYTIRKGGIGMYSWAHKFADSYYEAGNDYWDTMKMPNVAGDMFEGLNLDLINLQIKGYKGWQDSFATYARDTSRIDIVEAVSIVAEFYFFHSYSPSGQARRPIVAYKKLKAA